MTHLERIARAIKANRFRRTGRETLIPTMDPPSENEIDDVRAALTELLQLDDSTVEAGLRQQRECTFDGTSSASCAPEHVFVAMIKSILSEKDHG